MSQLYRTAASSDDFAISRRNMLRGTAMTAGVFAVGGGLGAFTGRAGAVSTTSTSIETLYLTDSGGDNGGSFLTRLYQVTLNSSNGRAELTLLADLTDTDFDQVDAIAASLDGTVVYMVDKNSRHLGTYDVAGGVFTDLGVISGLPGGVVLATFSPGGDLLVASQNDNKIYTVDIGTLTASELVTVTGADVQGADIAFDATGTLYLYSSGSQELYTVDVANGNATLVGQTGDFFTGLAVRDAGNGDLVGSNTTRDQIVVVDKDTGAQGDTFDMYLDGSRYAYGFGDMTVGALDVEICLDCAFEGTVKFEYDEELDAFVPELEDDESFDDIAFASYVSKADETGEPIAVTFSSAICADQLSATVKAGGAEGTVPVTEGDDGEIVVSIEGDSTFENDKNGRLYAISYVEFECVEPSNDD